MSSTINNQASHSPSMAVVYHSNYGHTRYVAKHIAMASSAYVSTTMVDVMELKDENSSLWQVLDDADLIVFGSAVYMGSITADFKVFMDSTSRRWLARAWQGKLSAGFANSGGLSGDKLAVLQQLCLFAMQHGMNWVGLPLVPTGSSEHDLNRLSSFLGLMTQSTDAPVGQTPCQGDVDTAKWFGEHLAKTVLTYHR